MNSDEIRRAECLLNALVGNAVASAECDKYNLRIGFEGDLWFNTSSAWRVMRGSAPLFGSGDIGEKSSIDVQKALGSLKGLRVISTLVSTSWETQILLEKDCFVDVFPNSVQYEVWEAHTKDGWVIFSGGGVTVFPPATRAAPPAPIDIYNAKRDLPVTPVMIQLVTEIMQGIEGLLSVGLGDFFQTGCSQKGHRDGGAFDVVELNGIPIASLGEDEQMTSLLRAVQTGANRRGVRENYGPAGIFQNGCEVLVPKLKARFSRYLHIRM